ncbi:hypothetical protein Drorol1_Dr00012434 [Drosera rotundifolia]
MLHYQDRITQERNLAYKKALFANEEVTEQESRLTRSTYTDKTCRSSKTFLSSTNTITTTATTPTTTTRRSPRRLKWLNMSEMVMVQLSMLRSLRKELRLKAAKRLSCSQSKTTLRFTSMRRFRPSEAAFYLQNTVRQAELNS